MDTLLIQPYIVQYRLKKQGIPGHFIPIVGDILKIRAALKLGTPFDYSDQLFNKYGDYYYSSFGPAARLATCDPSIMNYVLNKNSKSYHKSTLMKSSIGSLLGQHNLLLTEGQLHAMHRKAISPAFHYNNLKSMHKNIYNSTVELCDAWSSAIDSSMDESVERNMHVEMSSLTLDVVSTNVFGTSSAKSSQVKKQVYNILQESLHAFQQRIFNMTGIIPFIRDLPLPNKLIVQRSRQQLQLLISDIISDRKCGRSSKMTEDNDLLDLLLSAEIDDKVTGKKFHFTDDEIYGQAITFVLAGHETTSNLLTWTFANLVQNPDVLHTLQHELDSVLHGDAPVHDKLQQLQYTEFVLMETLRLIGPVANIVRTAVEDNVVVASDGKHIKIHKGCGILLNFQRLHTDSKHWENPRKFDPSRFGDYSAAHPSQQNGSSSSKESSNGGTGTSDGLDDEVDTMTSKYTNKRKRISPYTLLPFSAGPRSCIGQNFAMLEAKVILASILQRFNIELVPGQKIEPSVMITVRVKGGLMIKLSKRTQFNEYIKQTQPKQ